MNERNTIARVKIAGRNSHVNLSLRNIVKRVNGHLVATVQYGNRNTYVHNNGAGWKLYI